MNAASVVVRAITLADVAGYRACVGAVMRERKYLAYLEPFSLAETASFVAGNIDNGNPHFIAARDTTVEEINAIMKAAADSAQLKGILNYNKAPLVSIDFNHDPASSTFDATLTKVAGRLVKVSAWYDNEWGFSNRMLDTTVALMNAK